MKKIILLSLIFISFFGCKNSKNNNKNWKAEIMLIEKEFNDMAQEKGLAEAFKFYAAENGVIKRGKKVIKGKNAIGSWYKKDMKPNETLTWKPTFVAVSNSGDMAYTYGNYTFTYLDSLKNEKQNKGIFHTVWKRQKDGKWRFVWD